MHSLLIFPETKTPIEDCYEEFTGRYTEFKNDIDNLFVEIEKEKKELKKAEKNKS